MRNPSTKVDFSLVDNANDDEEYEDNYRQSSKKRQRKQDDELVESDLDDDDDDDNVSANDDLEDDSFEEKETVEEKKIRMAREFLTSMKNVETDSDDDDDDESDGETSSSDVDDQDIIGKRLERERLKSQGMFSYYVASKVNESVKKLWEQCLEVHPNIHQFNSQNQSNLWVQQGNVKLFRGHDLTPTCVALHKSTGATAYSGSKDHSIYMWDVERQVKCHTIVSQWKAGDSKKDRNKGEVLAMAASDDGRYLAVGTRDATVKIYDVRINKTSDTSDSKGNMKGLIQTFEGHKGPITALAFRSKSLQLFSGSEDRCIRHFNLDEMAYIETLYGHQAGITGISCHGIRSEMPFSVGRDRTARAWKLHEESHLIFRGGSKLSNADCIAAVKDDWFLTGHDDGALCLWNKDKKKAVASVTASHGYLPTNCAGESVASVARGVVSCAALPGGDLAVTGSNDGFMRLWKVKTGESASERGIDTIGEIPIHGYVNDIEVGPKGRFCIAAIGQEPRLGRWDRVSCAKNRFAIITLRNDDTNTDENESIDSYESSDDESNDDSS